MKTLAGFLLACLLLPAAKRESCQAGISRPNVVLFLSDDHRADLLGCAGHPILKTPHIDRLAAEGVRFRNMFVTTSICAASRASILTGLYERRHRFTFKTPPLSAEHCAESYPALLKAAGYRTGFFGKFGVQVPRGPARFCSTTSPTSTARRTSRSSPTAPCGTSTTSWATGRSIS